LESPEGNGAIKQVQEGQIKENDFHESPPLSIGYMK
jgi:hypothetical protein